MVTKHPNFLDETLFNDCMAYSAKVMQDERLLYESSKDWNKDHDMKSVPILCHEISDNNKSLSDRVANCIKEKLLLSDYTVVPMMYFFKPGSHIAWHNDDHWTATVTIYIMNQWDINNGGLFLFKREGEIIGIPPERNLAVYQTEASPHAVSPLTMNSPYRVAIHSFISK